MDRILKVKHTADRNGHALACIENMPGEGAEFSAANLRALAYALEQIADAIGPMLELDTSDMDLPELVGALIDFAIGEHARAQVMSMEPEGAPGVFLVLNADGRITGPVHDAEKKARAWAAQAAEARQGSAFTVARRIAHCNTRIAIDWKEA